MALESQKKKLDFTFLFDTNKPNFHSFAKKFKGIGDFNGVMLTMKEPSTIIPFTENFKFKAAKLLDKNQRQILPDGYYYYPPS